MSDQEQTIEQRSNDNVTVLFKMKPGCIVKMEVHVTPIASKAAHTKAVKELKKEISLPGFRKGKVPDDVILKNFVKEVQRHYKEVLMDTAFREAVVLLGRTPFTTRSVRKSELKHEGKDGSAVLLFEYEATPDVPQVDPKEFDLKEKNVREPTQDEITQSLTKLKILHGTKNDITDRQAQEGDVVILSITQPSSAQAEDETETERKDPSVLVDHEQFYLKKGFLPDWLFQAIIGMNSGEKREAESVPEYKETASAHGKHCVIELHTIQECVFPEENDEFAMKTGASSMQDLQDKLTQRKKQELIEEAKDAIRQELKNELILKYAFDLPQSLIEGETEARFQPYLRSRQEAGQDISTKDEIRKEFQEEVKRYFTCLFLMERIAKQINPTFSQAEFFDELSHQMFKAPYQERVLYPGLSQEEVEQRILMNIMIKKCCDWCAQGGNQSLTEKNAEVI